MKLSVALVVWWRGKLCSKGDGLGLIPGSKTESRGKILWVIPIIAVCEQGGSSRKSVLAPALPQVLRKHRRHGVVPLSTIPETLAVSIVGPDTLWCMLIETWLLSHPCFLEWVG